jgi:hypothetical protein
MVGKSVAILKCGVSARQASGRELLRHQPHRPLGLATTSGVGASFEVNENVSHEVDVIGKLAEVCGKDLARGREVHIQGRLRTRRNADGERQRVIVAEGMYFVDATALKPRSVKMFRR